MRSHGAFLFHHETKGIPLDQLHDDEDHAVGLVDLVPPPGDLLLRVRVSGRGQAQTTVILLSSTSTTLKSTRPYDASPV